MPMRVVDVLVVALPSVKLRVALTATNAAAAASTSRCASVAEPSHANSVTLTSWTPVVDRRLRGGPGRSIDCCLTTSFRTLCLRLEL